MAAKPLTSEAIALAEKKINMTLDDIIKMSKTHDEKPKKQRVSGALAQRRTNFQGSQFPLAAEASKKAAAAPVSSRAFNRNRQFNVNKRIEAVAGQKNSANGGGFKIPVQQAYASPKQKPRTLDLLFASMKEERMRAVSQKNNGSGRNGGTWPIVPWARHHQHK